MAYQFNLGQRYVWSPMHKKTKPATQLWRVFAVILHGGATGRHMLNTPNGNLKALTYAVAYIKQQNNE